MGMSGICHGIPCQTLQFNATIWAESLEDMQGINEVPLLKDGGGEMVSYEFAQ